MSVYSLPAPEMNLILAQSAKMVSNRSLMQLLQRDPSFLGTVNGNGRFLLINRAFLLSRNISWQAHRLGFLPGDVLGCRNAESASKGCGTHKACSLCPLLQGLKEASGGSKAVQGQVNLELVKSMEDEALEAHQETLEFRLEPLEGAASDIFSLFFW
jgi:hypothetical protein